MSSIRSLLLAALALPATVACGDDGPGQQTDPTATGTTDAATGSESTPTGADSDADETGTTGEPGDGYPADVLDHLELPWPPYEYDEPLPAHFQTDAVVAMDNTPPGNPITDAGATLGRVLFYDRALSANETVACASCHVQSDGFTDVDTLSEGFEGGLTGRNSMNIANSRYYAPGHFFWDERADTLEDQVLMPIQDPVEMGLTLEQLVERVQGRPYYPFLFEQAFGDATIDEERISLALAQFVRSILSYRAPWDEGIAANGGDPMPPFDNYSAEQNTGKGIFFGPVGNCAICHMEQQGPPPMPGEPLANAAIFQLVDSVNNGLDAALDSGDNGVGDVAGDPGLNGVFKSPSLRNIELTGPYMHDGRFETLRDVIDHYDSGVQPHPNLDPRLTTPPGPGGGMPQQLNLTDPEKDALEAFLRTLTDQALIDDVRFSDPFLE